MGKVTKIDIIPDAATRARLEFTYEPSHNEWLVYYDLVLPLAEADCRGMWDHKPAKQRPKSHRRIFLTKDNSLRIPLGGTKISTFSLQYPFYDRAPDELDLPFRDGAHSMWDQERLGNVERYAITPQGIFHIHRPIIKET